MLKHMRGLQKKFLPTPDHAEELAKIEQIFNELKPKLECGGARLRRLLDVEKKLRDETAENTSPPGLRWAGRSEKNCRMPESSLHTVERTPALSYQGEVTSMAKRRANGEGNIRKRKDGRWEGRYTAGYHPKTGKRIIKNVLGRTQAETKAKLKKAIEDAQGIDVAHADDYTVGTWLHSWYDLYAQPNIRTATADKYHLFIEEYVTPKIGHINLTKLTARDLQKLYKELTEHGRVRPDKQGSYRLSTTTVRSVHLMLHCAFERAVKERLIQRNLPMTALLPKSREKK